jgi:hypothetical protein
MSYAGAQPNMICSVSMMALPKTPVILGPDRFFQEALLCRESSKAQPNVSPYSACFPRLLTNRPSAIIGQ